MWLIFQGKTQYPKHYKDLVKENQLFNKYYQGLGLIPEGEWDEFLKMLNTPLPVTFRINGNRSQAKEMLEVIQGHYLKNLEQVEVDGEVIKPPQQIEWYPDNVAWYMEVSRQSMRKSEMYSKFHKFLVSETESGNISRQEAVSMIPPLLLDVQPHHKVLDMCAAPGSKTAQLIELLHSDENQEVPDGFIIANDADNKRCYMMVHQIKRLQTPCCMIINHDASILPKLRSNTDEQHLQFYQFDRILADVPCSGDGTLRKNPDLWKRWNPTHACSLHGLQKKILKRGVELLAVGGRLVYSTCSFHPVEDEAIVANMLRKAEGCLELIDVRSQLPKLKSIPGITTWKVMSKEGTWYDKFDDLPQLLTNQIRHSMFPPTPEEAEVMQLEKCVRILPHHQNTGGFFIAVFQKTKTLPWMKNYSDSSSTGENVVKTKIIEHETIVQTETVEGGTITKTETVEDETTVKTESDSVEKNNDEDDKKRKPDGSESNRPQKKPRLQGYKEDPFLFTKNDDPFWTSIKSFYKLPESFACDQGMYRSAEGCKRSLYFVSAGIKNIVECNRDRLKFINMGVKLFSRAPSPLVPQCDFRVAQECLSCLHNNFTGRHVDINKDDAFIILTQENPLIETLTPDTKKYLNELSKNSSLFTA
ncbi:hypothetical protein LOTGIDRAFT_122705 [Lottia gigantea]|uniref:tRNA (cytosine(34)-C(5))-methyltransferase n=1 Tax=Lottia gigantea TaxID=225164 RepID=V4ABW0_LOTGI|nr:hypothetical protein LOTGIDRAFT_122705 [Lottia gigantea]ESO90796.1 hypothetical protein LOTGIDRAFT_122705 [Lottia gigantea]